MVTPFHWAASKRVLNWLLVAVMLGAIAAPAFSPRLDQAVAGPAEAMTFSAESPALSSSVGMSNPDVSVRALDTDGNNITSATATIDGASVAATLVGAGTAEAEASFSTYDLTTGAHSVSVTFEAEGGGTATDTWTFDVAPLTTHRLAYSAGPNGSIVGSATQDVRSGSSSTELEGFESLGQWVAAVPSSLDTDTANVLHGPTSLKLTSALGVSTYASKNVSLDLSSSAPLRLYFYLAENPRIAWTRVTLSFYTSADPSNRLSAAIEPERMDRGWNCVSLARSDFSQHGTASWADAFTRMEMGVSGTATTAVSFDSLQQTTGEDPALVAVTFDDALQSAFDQGYQYMVSRGLPGTAYVIPRLVDDGPNYLTVPELKTMDAGGWDVANHTLNHTILTTVTQAEAEAELTGGRDWLIANGLPGAASDVAYPWGAWNETVLSAMVATGMHSGRTTDQNSNVLPLFDPYRINAVFPASLPAAESWVDTATAQRSLVVLGFHALEPVASEQNPLSVSDFRSLIDYIAARPITIVRMSDIVGRHSNDGFTVTALPAAGHHFVGWSDGVQTSSRRETNVESDQSVTAQFAVDTYTLDYATSGAGSIDGSATQVIEHGSDATSVTATPALYHHFVRWSDGLTTPTRQATNVTANASATAIFAIDTYTLDYATSGAGSIDGSATQVIEHGSDATSVTATPDAHHHFVRWSDGLTTPTRQATNVTADTSATAVFAIDTYQLEYLAGPNGSIDGSATQVIEHGSDATSVTATPDAHHHFVRWSDGLTAPTRRDMSVTTTASVTASFAIDTYAVGYAVMGGGSIEGSATQVIDHGSDATTVTAAPALYHHFVSWSDGVTTPTRQATNVTANGSVTAVFAIDTYTLALRSGGVSPSRPRHGQTATFRLLLTPADGATAGSSTLALYHWETKRVWKKVHRRWRRVKVRYWRLRSRKTMAANGDGSLSVRYKLPYSGSWKMVVTYTGPAGQISPAWQSRTFKVR